MAVLSGDKRARLQGLLGAVGHEGLHARPLWPQSRRAPCSVMVPRSSTRVREHQPDGALGDIRMPPTFTPEGAARGAAARGLALHPAALAVARKPLRGLSRSREPARFGHLLKDRVVDVATLVDAVARVATVATPCSIRR